MRTQTIYKLLALVAATSLSAPGICQESEAWLYKRSIDVNLGPTPGFNLSHPSLKLTDGQLEISANCSAQFSKQKYEPTSLFQPAIKSGKKVSEINKTFEKYFEINLKNVDFIYTKNNDPKNCATIDRHFIVSGERIIFIIGGLIFEEYSRTFTRIIYDRNRSPVDLGKIKPSQLPFDLKALDAKCLLKKLPFYRGAPQATEKCGPEFYPYVATRRSNDWLSKLVGSFDYRKNNVRHANLDYENPVANGMHPVFTVLPPMDDVIVVRVDDMEYSESRDSMNGTYLSIKNGKVVDVLSEGCDFDVSYTCSNHNPEEKFQLQPDGRFKKIQ